MNQDDGFDLAGFFTMMLESVCPEEVSEQEFQDAANKISSYSWLPDSQKLQFYGLYKQSTIGDVNTKQPWSINMVAKAKWWVEWSVSIQ
jgi:acyl-CoA-binding protein